MDNVGQNRTKRTSLVEEIIQILNLESINGSYEYLSVGNTLYDMCSTKINELRNDTEREQNLQELQETKRMLRLPRELMIKEINKKYLAFDLEQWKRQHIGQFSLEYM